MVWFLLAQLITILGLLKISVFREKLVKRFPWLEKKKDHISIVCIVLGVCLSTQKYFSKTGDLNAEISALNDKNQTLSNKLNEATDSIKENQERVEAVRRFSFIAPYDFRGQNGDFELKPIRELMDGTWEPSNTPNSFRPVCSETSQSKWKKVIEKFPDFPYSYFSFARCLLEKKDPSWRGYGQSALKVLRGTAQIPNHQESQDSMIKYLEANLASGI